MKYLRSAVLITAAAAFVAVCMGAKGCGGSDIHKASVAADSIGVSLATAAQVNHDLAAAGEETLEERQHIARAIDEIAKANDAFTRSLQQLSAASAGSGAQTLSQQVVEDFTTLVTLVDQLQNEDVLHLKSQSARDRYAVVMTAIRAQIQIFQALIGPASSGRVPGQTGSLRSPSDPPAHKGRVMLGGLTLTSIELEELIGLALTAGSSLVSKLRAMKGETDAQLQADALAQDAIAEKLAEADEGPA